MVRIVINLVLILGVTCFGIFNSSFGKEKKEIGIIAPPTSKLMVLQNFPDVKYESLDSYYKKLFISLRKLMWNSIIATHPIVVKKLNKVYPLNSNIHIPDFPEGCLSFSAFCDFYVDLFYLSLYATEDNKEIVNSYLNKLNNYNIQKNGCILQETIDKLSLNVNSVQCLIKKNNLKLLIYSYVPFIDAETEENYFGENTIKSINSITISLHIYGNLSEVINNKPIQFTLNELKQWSKVRSKFRETISELLEDSILGENNIETIENSSKNTNDVNAGGGMW